MTEPWWTLARWGIMVFWTIMAVLLGDPIVRTVFHLAGEGAPPQGSAAAPEETRLGSTEDAAAVSTGADLGQSEPLSDATPSSAAEELSPIEAAGARLRGGKVIGWLERLATCASLLAGFSAGLAVIVAVKGLARYPDLKSSDGTAERFILGTFTSLLVASAGAGIAHWSIGLLPAPR